MTIWPRYPKIFEINTWVWLSELSAQSGRTIDLGRVPSMDWDAIAGLGFDAVWLMGVWERSPAGIAIANRSGNLLEDFRRALPDFQPKDNVGSPYCVRRYVVDRALGGPEGLATARKELARRGLRLILDLVPNHVAPDHPWAIEHPEYFIQGTADDIRRDPTSFVDIQGRVYACGRDPYFPAWPDVLQLNAFQPSLRQAVIETVSTIANQCDGIRCDMAMLLLNGIFARTWGARAGQPPTTEYWVDLITAIKRTHPNFLFMAEAYWELEWELQQKGFDFCYDKKLYDRLIHDTAESVRLHLCADLAYQGKLLRFIENHDEPRAATVFSPAKERVAALTMATVPGAKLFHEGQFEGRRIRIPVFLGRRPVEPVDTQLQAFYRQLLATIQDSPFREGEWRLNDRSGWPDNPSFQNVVSWSWIKDDDLFLIVVNLSDSPAQARVQIPGPDLRGKTWRLTDSLSGVTYDRDGNEMQASGLFVALEPFNFHCFHCRRLEQARPLTRAAAS